MPFFYIKFNIKERYIKLVVPFIIFLLFSMIYSIVNIDNNTNQNEDKIINTNPSSNKNEENTIIDNSQKQNNKSNNLTNITDSKLKDNFINACKQINMDTNLIKELKKVDDWNSGPRYTFEYKGIKFILYAYDSGEVSSITISNKNLDKIYLEGYEPYDVNDFILDASKITDMQLSAESSIKSVLNYPDTAKFKWLSSGGYGKVKNIYTISGSFEAKNSFGIKSEQSFYIEEEIINGNFSVVYMIINNQKYIGTTSKIKNEERKEIKINNGDTSNQSENVIILKDGQKGEYGKEDLFDGEKYIRYYIPAGKYEVEALTKNAQFFIEEVKIHKEFGYDTATTIRKVILANYGDKDIIEITSNHCITLVLHTQIKLTKQ